MPTNAHTSARRKAAGLCVYDGRKARPGMVLCARCAATQRRSKEKARTAALQARMQAAGIYVAYPPRPEPAPAPRQGTVPAARLLLCCGAWWHITHIPLVVPCCGRLWLQEDPHA